VVYADSANYEALRLLTETQLERHLFATAVESSRRLIQISEADPWNWGTLGDAYVEMGEYEKGAEAYQKMVSMRPDLASYNRGGPFSFSLRRRAGRDRDHEKAIEAGSSSPEKRGVVMVDLGNIYFKSGQIALSSAILHGCSADVQELPSGVCGTRPGARGKWRCEGSDRELSPAPRRSLRFRTMPHALYGPYKKSGQADLAAKQMEFAGRDPIKCPSPAVRKRIAI